LSLENTLRREGEGAWKGGVSGARASREDREMPLEHAHAVAKRRGGQWAAAEYLRMPGAPAIGRARHNTGACGQMRLGVEPSTAGIRVEEGVILMLR
jgi:hypothetical protein